MEVEKKQAQVKKGEKQMKKLGLLLIIWVLVSCAPQPTGTPTTIPVPTATLTSVEAEWFEKFKEAPYFDRWGKIWEEAPTDHAKDAAMEWDRTHPEPTSKPAIKPTPVPRESPTAKIHETKTKVFAGQTPGEALAEWKEAFPERTVVEWKIGLDGDGNPVELKIWYTK